MNASLAQEYEFPSQILSLVDTIHIAATLPDPVQYPLNILKYYVKDIMLLLL